MWSASLKGTIFLLASALSASADAGHVAITVNPASAVTRLDAGAYGVTFTVENQSDRTISRLIVIMVGRNSAGQIVERGEAAPVTDRNLPYGLAPGESMIESRAILRNNRLEDVVTLEVQVRDIEFRD